MKNRMTLLLAFLAAFLITSPTFAAPPEEEAKAAESSDEAKAEPEAAPSDEAKAEPEAAPSDEATEGDTKADPAGPAELKTDEEALDAAKQLIAAAQQGHWALVIAFGIMLLVYVLNRVGLLEKLGPKAVPWVAAGTGVLGYVAAYLMVDGTSIVEGLTQGVMTGAAAVGLWELLFKHIMGGKTSS